MSARQRRLRLLAAADLDELHLAGRLPRVGRRSAVTVAADVVFWLVYGGVVALVGYVAFCAPR